MNISLSSRQRDDVRTVVVVLRTDDEQHLIDLIDQLSGQSGWAGVLGAQIAAGTSLVDERSDPRSDAARLLRRAAEILEEE